MKTLLTAEWTNLLVATFETDKTLLKKFLPAKTELSEWKGKYFMSLVGFIFSNPRLLSIPSPFYRKFEEVNLRFYVRHKEKTKWKNGVVFIKEIATSPLIGLVAKWLYHENFISLPLKHNFNTTNTEKGIEYSWKLGNNWNYIKSQTSLSRSLSNNTIEAFIADHYWAYTKAGDHKTFEFEIEHPPWNIYPSTSFKMNLDAEKIYGSEFAEYFQQDPLTVFLMDGSTTKVSYPKLV